MSFPLNPHEDVEASNLPPDPPRKGLEPISRPPDPPRPETTPAIARSRYDQPALDSVSTTYASSLSHERTNLSAYSSMESEMQKRGQGDNTDVDAAGSVYSYNSTRDISQFVKEFHGRVFNNLSDLYLLPSDQTEWARLDKQGSAMAIGFGGLYPCPEIVEAVLLPTAGGPPKRILDVGCGTGAWAMQMAIKFPHASVLGVDVAPSPIDSSSFPPNLSLEIDDITLGLGHFAGAIDLVHMRCVSNGIRDIDKTLLDLQKCLKPGGLVIVVDGDTSMLSEDRKTIIPFIHLPGDGGPEVTGVSERGSWFRRLFWEACEACEIGGSSLTRVDHVNDVGLWDSPLCDPETCRSGGVDFPIGPWATSSDPSETQLLQFVGVLMRQNLLSIHRAYHAILLKHGMSQATLDDWSNRIDEELDSLPLRMWIRFRFFMGRRRAGKGLPAPPLPLLSSSGGNYATSAQNGEEARAQQRHTRYPALDVYYTREEAFARMRQRLSGYGVFPPSVARRAWARYQETGETT